MRRTGIIYGTAAAVVLAVVGYAAYEDGQSDDVAVTGASVEQDQWGRLGDWYREYAPDATDEQIAQWEEDRAAYEAQQAEVEECELDAQADQDAAGSAQDAASADMDAAPLADEDGYAAAEAEYNAAVDDYNAALNREDACDARIDGSLVEDHPLFEVDGDMVTYLGP